MIVKVIKLSQRTNWQHWSLAMMIDAQMKPELKQHCTTTMSTQNSRNSTHAGSQQQQHPHIKKTRGLKLVNCICMWHLDGNVWQHQHIHISYFN